MTNSNNKQLISITNPQGQYIYVNDAFCQHIGYSEQELLSMDSHSITHSQMPKNVLSELSATLKKGFSWQGVLQVVSRDNKDIWLNTFITPQYELGKIIGYQSISTVADSSLISNAQHIYNAVNNQHSWTTFELTKNHKFAFLVLLSIIAQLYIFSAFGWHTSLIAALSALTPIVVFWSDIIPTALRAQRMQNMYDSISRKVYFGKGTASIFDFNFSMMKTKIKAILERSIDATKPIKSVMDKVSSGLSSTRTTLETQSLFFVFLE